MLKLNALTQFADSLELDKVELRIDPLSKESSFDSILEKRLTSIAQILIDQSSAQIQEYGGKGAIKSLSVRGLTSSHNKMVWNGLQINSLTLGMFDFGGVSTIGNTYLNLNQGTNIENDGDGAIGGSVSIGSNSKFNQGIDSYFETSVGSFGDYLYGITAGISKRRWLYKVSASKEGAKNDYVYVNRKRIGFPTIKQENAEFKSTNLVQEIKYQRKGLIFKSISWWNGKRVNIPNTLLESSKATGFNADSSFRSVLEIKKHLKSLQVVGVLGTDRQWFEHSNSRINSYTYYQTINNQLGIRLKYNFKQFTFNLKSNTQLQSAENTNYEGDKFRTLSLTSLNSRYISKNELTKLSITLGGQSSSAVNGIQPLTSFNYVKSIKRINLTGGVSSHFRQPTFNDLFWFNVTNENLNSEYGWSVEQGLAFNYKSNLEIKSVGYYSIIDNWIMWVNNGGSWNPENIKQVNANGLELEVKGKINYKKLGLRLNNSSTYTKTTVTKSKLEDDLSIGKQAMYIPLWNSTSNLAITYKGWLLSYNLRYNGLRYMALDNNEDSALPNYWLSNLGLEKKVIISKIRLSTNFQVRNIFNQYYEVFGNIPMPGRAYYLTLKINFKTKKS